MIEIVLCVCGGCSPVGRARQLRWLQKQPVPARTSRPPPPPGESLLRRRRRGRTRRAPESTCLGVGEKLRPSQSLAAERADARSTDPEKIIEVARVNARKRKVKPAGLSFSKGTWKVRTRSRKFQMTKKIVPTIPKASRVEKSPLWMLPVSTIWTSA